MGYGLYQGLNEAFDSYQHQTDYLQHKKDMQTARDSAAVQAERDKTNFENQQEQYKYGISQRGNQEKLTKQQIEAGDLSISGQKVNNESAKLTLDEWKKNAPAREKEINLKLGAAKLALDNAGITYDLNTIGLDAKKDSQKYIGWAQQWNQGATIEDMAKHFSQDDNDPTNDIKSYSGSEKDGWDITFENGRTMRFDTRDDVAIHLQSMADPKFQQTYLLQQKASQAALAKVIKQANMKTTSTIFKEKTEWDKRTEHLIDRQYGKYKEGIISYGKAGDRNLGRDIAAVVTNIGRRSQFSLNVANVSRVANSLANKMLVPNEDEAKSKAAEVLKEGAGTDANPMRLEPGQEGYEDLLNREMARAYDQSYDQFERVVYSKFFHMTQNGDIGMNDPSKVSGYNETDKKADTKPLIPAPTRDTPELGAAAPHKQEAISEKGVARQQEISVKRDFRKQKKKQYGIISNNKGRIKLTAGQRYLIKKDYVNNFPDWDKYKQQAFVDAYGKYLGDSADKARSIAYGVSKPTSS